MEEIVSTKKKKKFLAGRNPLLVLVRVFARRQIFINLDRFEHEVEEATDELFLEEKKY